MNKLCMQYTKKVTLLFPVMGKSERKYVNDLKVNIQDYLDNNEASSVEDLYQEFGTPQDAVTQYYATMDTEQIVRRVRTARYVRFTLYALIMSLFISTLVYCTILYREHKAFMEESFIASEETIIE